MSNLGLKSFFQRSTSSRAQYPSKGLQNDRNERKLSKPFPRPWLRLSSWRKGDSYDVILYSMEIGSIYIEILMEEQKDEVKKYLTGSVNPVLKPIVEAIAKVRPPNIMKFILEYAQK
jgi:hypothetical protein